MRTALMIGSNYRTAMQIRKRIDWDALGITCYLELNDAGALGKIESLRPEILLLGSVMFSDWKTLVRTACKYQKRLYLICMDGTLDTAQLPDGVNLRYTSSSELNTVTLDAILREEPQMQQISDNGGTQQFVALLETASEQDALYLLRAAPCHGYTFPQNTALEQGIAEIFEEMWFGCCRMQDGTLCIILREAKKVSILYSMKVLGDMTEALYQYLTLFSPRLQPILVSASINRRAAANTWRDLQADAALLYFCPKMLACTQSQLHARQAATDPTAFRQGIDAVLQYVLGGNPVNACAALDHIYMLLKGNMDYDGLIEARRQLLSIPALTGCELRQPPDDAWDNIEEEQAWMRRMVSDCCRKQTAANVHHGIAEAMQYVLEHYSEELTMEQMAVRVGLSPSYFSRQFKETAGHGFTEYVNRIRVQQAKALFRTGETGIETVARRVGYADPKYFSRVFRRQTGQSPSAFLMRKGDSET